MEMNLIEFEKKDEIKLGNILKIICQSYRIKNKSITKAQKMKAVNKKMKKKWKKLKKFNRIMYNQIRFCSILNGTITNKY